MQFNWCVCVILFLLGIVPGVIYVVVYLIVGADEQGPAGQQQSQQQQQQVIIMRDGGAPARVEQTRTCGSCGSPMSGRFCPNCGWQAR